MSSIGARRRVSLRTGCDSLLRISMAMLHSARRMARIFTGISRRMVTALLPATRAISIMWWLCLIVAWGRQPGGWVRADMTMIGTAWMSGHTWDILQISIAA